MADMGTGAPSGFCGQCGVPSAQCGGHYKSPVPRGEKEQEKLLPTEHLPKAPDPSPFKGTR